VFLLGEAVTENVQDHGEKADRWWCENFYLTACDVINSYVTGLSDSEFVLLFGEIHFTLC